MIAFIDDHRQAHGVEPICRVLPIALSTYHAHVAKRVDPSRLSARDRRDAALKEEVRRVFEANFRVYGVRKVWRQLQREGFDVARCTVARLMRAMGLEGIIRGKPIRTTVSDKAAPCPLDHVNRQFHAPAPNMLWVSDFTYVATWTGFVYVAFVIDTYARRIVGWRVSRTAHASFVLDALEQALHDRRPVQGSRLVHHSDRGSQYVSIRYTERLAEAGIGAFQRKPAVFGNLPQSQVSHCYEGRKLQEFSGKRVAVIGAGQSALESAALLHETGAEVETIAKITELRWIGGHAWLHHLGPVSTMLYSKYDVGPAGISRLVSFPQVVRYVPLSMRDKIRKRAVRPAGSRWLPARLKPTKITLGRSVKQASSAGTEINLKLDDGSERRVDHVLLGTGYDVEVSRYSFLSPELVKSIRQFDGYPILSDGLQSSVSGLHFSGAAAARSFGPLLYFVAGTEFASRALASYIARNGVNGQ